MLLASCGAQGTEGETESKGLSEETTVDGVLEVDQVLTR